MRKLLLYRWLKNSCIYMMLVSILHQVVCTKMIANYGKWVTHKCVNQIKPDKFTLRKVSMHYQLPTTNYQ